MATILVIGIAEGPLPSTATAAAISLARSLGGTVQVRLIADGEVEAGQFCDRLVAAVDALVRDHKPELVLLPSLPGATECAARLAVRLDAAFAPDCTSLGRDGDRIIATRMVCGGALIADYGFNRPLAIVTLALGHAEGEADAGDWNAAPLALPPVEGRVKLLETLPDLSVCGPPLKQAKAVVSGGLGIGSAENWAVIEQTAQVLGAAVGASRAAVETGWAPYSAQVGFSGAKIRPDLYIAAGISGAVHHLAGIAGAKTVVAINSDPEAPIFRHARFGIVGDAVEGLTAFAGRVRELRG